MKKTAKRFLRTLVGLAILAFGVGVSLLLWVTRPKAEEKPPEQSFPVVEVIPVTYQTKSFAIPTQGLIEASRRSQLAAEVGGRVVEVSEFFEPGNAVKKGDMLLKVDPIDYATAVAQAKTTIAEAEAALENEKALSAIAESDWKKMGRSGTPTDLAVRGPQLRSAAARVKSANATLAKAENDLNRATIRAPYDAVIASKSTELGSFLTPGTPVAEVFDTGPYEVRLPLSIDEIEFLKTGPNGKPTGEVIITAEVAGKSSTWTGEIIRTEGEISRTSRSVYVVAQVNPKSDDDSASLQPGQFVKASIPGRDIPHLAAIPFSAFLGLERIAIVDDNDLLQFRETSVVFREGETVFIGNGPAEGERLCVTELSRMIQGDKVTPVEAGSLNPKSESNLKSKVKS